MTPVVVQLIFSLEIHMESFSFLSQSTKELNFLSVQDHEHNNVGNICLRTNTISITNDRNSHMTIAKINRTRFQQSHHIFQLTLHTQTSLSVVAEAFRENDNNNIVVNMSNNLDVHKKALALTRAMLAASFFNKIYSKTEVPTFPGYSYRRH